MARASRLTHPARATVASLGVRVQIIDARETTPSPTPEPGIYSHVPFAEYLAWPYLSKSALRSFEVSPAQYQHELAQPFEPSDAMVLGSMVDTLWFDGREAYEAAFLPAPAIVKRRQGSVWGDFEFGCKGLGIVPVLYAQAMTAERMVDALYDHHGAMRAREGGLSQLSLVWDDPETGIRCKGRPDIVDPDRRGIDDLKTSRDISPGGFSKACSDYNYHWQGRHYLSALETLTGEPWDGGFRLITVRNKPVHGVQIYRMADAALELARDELRVVLARMRACIIMDHWPSAEQSELTVDLKRWRYTR